jgi:hypothetical protein
MKKTLLAIAALGALALSACSSDETPGTSPGDENPTPQATSPIAPTTPTTLIEIDPNWTNPLFCQAYFSGWDAEDDLNAASDELNSTVDEDPANWDSPEAVAALHAQGQVLLFYAEQVAGLYDQAANYTGDRPAVAEALATMSEYVRTFYVSMGQAAVDAESVMDYATSREALFLIDPDEMSALGIAYIEAGPIVSDYVSENCVSSY